MRFQNFKRTCYAWWEQTSYRHFTSEWGMASRTKRSWSFSEARLAKITDWIAAPQATTSSVLMPRRDLGRVLQNARVKSIPSKNELTSMEVLVDEESIRFALETLNGAWEYLSVICSWKLRLLYKMAHQSIDKIYTSKIAVTRCFDFDDSLMQDDYWYVEIVRAGFTARCPHWERWK